jgi:hypothetical protein
MTIDEAFRYFRSRLLESGIGVPNERSHQEAFGSRYSEIELYDGGFRLVFDGRDSMLTLEISHGPPGARAGWLDLFSAHCANSEFAGNEGENLGFEETVAYGIELLAPAS